MFYIFRYNIRKTNSILLNISHLLRIKLNNLILFYNVMDYYFIVTGKWLDMCEEAPRLALWPRLLLVMIDIHNNTFPTRIS